MQPVARDEVTGGAWVRAIWRVGAGAALAGKHNFIRANTNFKAMTSRSYQSAKKINTCFVCVAVFRGMCSWEFPVCHIYLFWFQPSSVKQGLGPHLSLNNLDRHSPWHLMASWHHQVPRVTGVEKQAPWTPQGPIFAWFSVKLVRFIRQHFIL